MKHVGGWGREVGGKMKIFFRRNYILRFLSESRIYVQYICWSESAHKSANKLDVSIRATNVVNMSSIFLVYYTKKMLLMLTTFVAQMENSFYVFKITILC